MDSDPGIGSDLDTDFDLGTGSNIDTGSDTHMETGTDTNTDTDSNTDIDSGTDTNTDTDLDSYSTWIRLDGGDFMMGSPVGVGEPEEQPEHLVSIQTFEILRTEVTVDQYRECVEEGSCTAPDTTDADCSGSFADQNNWIQPGRDNHPINCITWQQAVDFCAWMGGRLPTEAEWEFAAGNGPLETLYPWGETAPSCELAQINMGGPGCGTGWTSHVCSKPSGNTTHGLCDMAGNVWEWTGDHVHDDYIGAPTDGSAWLGNPTGNWITRGAGYMHDFEPPEYLRTARRAYAYEENPWTDVGIRCVRRD